MSRYIVRLFMDNTYEVLLRDCQMGEDGKMFQGSLSDCEAWIGLS